MRNSRRCGRHNITDTHRQAWRTAVDFVTLRQQDIELTIDAQQGAVDDTDQRLACVRPTNDDVDDDDDDVSSRQ